MRPCRLSSLPAALAVLALSGCGYVHVGKLPEPAKTVLGDDKLIKENSDLRTEKKILQQELLLTRAQSDALRFAIENRSADGDTTRRLTDKLAETAKELASLRANYAQLQSARATGPAANPAELADLRTKLAGTEEKLAVSLRNFTELQQEVGGLRRQVEEARTENQALTAHVKTVTGQNEQIRAALEQLNTDLLAQKDSRARAEQDAATLKTQLDGANSQLSALSAQRTASAAEAKSLNPVLETELRSQLNALQQKVTALETERTALQRQLSAAEIAAKTPGLAETKALADTQAQLIAALGSAKMLRDENDSLKTAATQSTSLKEQLAQTQAKATALSEENAQLKNRLSSARPATTITVGAPPTTPAPAAAASNPNPNARLPGSAVTASFVVAPPAGAPAPAAGLPAPASGTPTAAPAGAPARPQIPGARYHTVSGGDTLSKISSQYYGTPGRWAEILVANREVLGEDNNLVIGRQLRIP